MSTSGVGHHVTAVPVRKLDSGSRIIAWRFACTCGRKGEGWHRTPEHAVQAGEAHTTNNGAPDGR